MPCCAHKACVVLYLAPFSTLGGTESYLRHTSQFHNRERVRPAYALLRGGGPLIRTLRETDAEVYVLPYSLRLRNPYQVMRAARWTRCIVRHTGARLIHSALSYAAVFGGWAAMCESLPHLWFQHGPLSGPHDYVATLLPAEAILVNSQYMYTEQRRICRRIGREPAMLVHPPGIDPDYSRKLLSDRVRVTRRRAELRHAWDVSDDELIAGMVTRIVRWKGIDLFFDAMEQLRRSGVQMRGIVIGDLPQRAVARDSLHYSRLRARAARSDAVRLVGWSETPLEAMLALDCVVNCSRIPEPFGTTIIEAMSLGLPVVAPRFGGPSEIITDGADGLLFTPRSACDLARVLILLASDLKIAPNLGSKAIETVRSRFDIRDGVERLESLYEHILSPTYRSGSL